METVEFCEGVWCHPVLSSADVHQRGTVRQRMRGSNTPSGVSPHPQGARLTLRLVRQGDGLHYPVGRSLFGDSLPFLLTSDLPECQPVVLCSSQRNQRGWQQRVPILSERKGEIAAKSCSYAHNRRMSHLQTHLQHVGSPDTEDNDLVRHPQTGNDRNQKDTDETAS